jgi:hypothetical protein
VKNLKIIEEINSSEFQELILLIIKFIISSGELKPNIIKRIKLFNKISNVERISNLKTLKKLLSSDELEGYEAGLIAQINLEENSRLKQLNNLLLKAIRTLRTENMRKRIEEWETLVSNKFIPPIVSNVPPMRRANLRVDDEIVFKKYIKVNGEKQSYSKLYLTIKRGDYMNIGYFKKYESIFNTVSDGHLLRIFAQYKDVWFKDMSKILTQNKLQFIIPIDYNSGLIQISYSDRYNADFWNAFKNEKDVKKYLTKILNEMFPEKNIKEPEWITMHFWKAGDHMWNVGVNTKKIQEKIDEIFIPKDIYILGETYSERQAWIEGAIETVHKKLNI